MTDTDNVDNRRRHEAIEALRKSAVPLPEGYKFNRDEIYDERFDNSLLGRLLKESALESDSLDGRTLDSK